MPSRAFVLGDVVGWSGELSRAELTIPHACKPTLQGAALCTGTGTLLISFLLLLSHGAFRTSFATDFHDKFTLGEFLGSGTFGSVHVCTQKATGERWVVGCGWWWW